ncbi:unnamed protein product [Clavelina lepadiformis]|uniref:Protein kinase C-binding protein 1 n=1 Tax=Clavelina lepadiformis TaxID=159417 RepID=A0ABP0FNW4_CLALP
MDLTPDNPEIVSLQTASKDEQQVLQQQSLSTPMDQSSDLPTAFSMPDTPMESATGISTVAGLTFAALAQELKPDEPELCAVTKSETETFAESSPSAMDVSTVPVSDSVTSSAAPSAVVTSSVIESAASPMPKESSTRSLLDQASPFARGEIASPTRSLTPLSDKMGRTSPIEAMDTILSVKSKSDLDEQHPSPLVVTASSYRARSSSQSSKSSKGSSPSSQKSPVPPKRKEKARPPPPAKVVGEHDGRNDFYCWVCHKEGEVLCCELCPRVMHAKCLRMEAEPEGDWFCPECERIMEAECKETQSRSMSQLSIDQLALHLRYALQRMKTTGCEPFAEPVNTKEFTDYLDYVFHPMDLNTLEKNVKKRIYGSTEAFLADVKWILHNCIIYNGTQTKLTNIAKTIIKIAQHEMTEIEVCPECYLNACRKRDNWFCEPCHDPHVLVWAKLQGFPHWPAKALRVEKGLVDARFFGQHDRAWIPLSGCYIMSKEMPLPVKNKKKGRGPGAKGGLDNAIQEMQGYIDNVVRKSGKPFEYAPPRTPLTHMDIYRRTAGHGPAVDMSKEITGRASSTSLDSSSKLSTVAIKKEAMENEALKSSGASPLPKPLESVLNLKLDSVGLDSTLTTSSVPPKKKSKVVTTSGAHPQKGTRPFNPKKRANMALLDKTIESLRESVENEVHDHVSTESDSSSEEDTNEGSSSNKSTPTSQSKGEKDSGKNKELNVEKERVKNDKKTKKEADSDVSDSELIIDVGEEEEKKKESTAGSLTEKGLFKIKKRSTVDDAKPKTKSILLNKDHDPTKKAAPSGSTPVRAAGTLKRKFAENSPTVSTEGKVRKVEGMSNPSKSRNADRPLTAAHKISGKILPDKEKKKHSLDEARKSDSLKASREGSYSPHAATGAKKSSSEVLLKKKALSQVTASSKLRAEDSGDLRSEKAKMLAKRMMNKKDGPGGDKPKEKSNPAEDKGKGLSSHTESTRKLSSFTIPKHKPMSRKEIPVIDETHNTIPGSRPTASHGVNGSSSTENVLQKSKPNQNVPLQKFQKYNDRLMKSMQEVLSEIYEDMTATFQGSQSNNSLNNETDGNTEQQVTQLRLEIQRLKWMHKQEIAEIQHNHDLTVAEIRQSLENEKIHLLDVAKRKSEAEKTKAIEETKLKQWCANCRKEAIFYCCWNTSYCDYPCQQLHWPKHMATCSQARGRASSASNMKDVDRRSPGRESGQDKVKEDIEMSDEEEHSDTDMMVIDESHPSKIEPSNAKEDLSSPLSPDDAKPSLKQKPETSKSSASTSTTSSIITPSTKSNSSIEAILERTSALASVGQVQPIAGAVVSALTSDTKSKPLPLKSATSSTSASQNTSSSAVVSSKLIDDIFSKVTKKATAPPLSTSLPSPTTSILKGILNNPSKSTAQDTSPASSSTLETSTSTSGKLDASSVATADAKAHMSGFAISAIGDRLLKARQQTSAESQPGVSSATMSGDKADRDTDLKWKDLDTATVESITEPKLSTTSSDTGGSHVDDDSKTSECSHEMSDTFQDEDNKTSSFKAEDQVLSSSSKEDLPDKQSSPSSPCNEEEQSHTSPVAIDKSPPGDHAIIQSSLDGKNLDNQTLNRHDMQSASAIVGDFGTTGEESLKLEKASSSADLPSRGLFTGNPEAETMNLKSTEEVSSGIAPTSTAESFSIGISAPVFVDSYLSNLQKMNSQQQASHADSATNDATTENKETNKPNAPAKRSTLSSDLQNSPDLFK